MAKSKTGPGGWRQGLCKFLYGTGSLLLVLGLLAGTTALRPYDILQQTETPAVTDTLTPTITQTVDATLFTNTDTPITSATLGPSATQKNVTKETPGASPTAPPEGLLNNPQLRTTMGVAAAACCLGLLLAGVLIGIAVWFRRHSRRGKVQAGVSSTVQGTGTVQGASAIKGAVGKECPRCGANCQADARFCYRCGLSFVQSAVLPRPTDAPPPPPVAPIACTKCGQPLRAASKFCPKCGQPTGR